jgi:hypothetical protein
MTVAYRKPPDGTLISMRVSEGCFGFAPEIPFTQTNVVVGGRDGLRIETQWIADPEPLPLLSYVVPLTDGPCGHDDYEFLSAGTTLESAGGDYEQNKAILDAMMLGLEFTATP